MSPLQSKFPFQRRAACPLSHTKQCSRECPKVQVKVVFSEIQAGFRGSLKEIVYKGMSAEQEVGQMVNDKEQGRFQLPDWFFPE